MSALDLCDGIKSQFEAAGLTNTGAQIDRLQTRWEEYQDSFMRWIATEIPKT